MSEEKRNSGAAEERDEPKSAAERRSEERRAAREHAVKKRETTEANRRKPATAKSRKPAAKERPVSEAREGRPRERPEGPGPARLFALLAGAFLSLLGVLGFFYDASFDTGADLASDDLAGILMVNGWRNVIYLGTGLAALAFAARRPRATATALGLLYLLYAIWGFIVTERDIGDILGFLPLSNEDNVLHLLIGVLGLGAALADGPPPAVPESVRKRLRPPKRKPKPKRSKQRRPARPVAKEPEKRSEPRSKSSRAAEKDEKKSASSTDSA